MSSAASSNSPPASAPGPLSGYRVVDATNVVAGPYATQILADLGADVIKIEAVPAGDLMRGAGPSPTGDMAPLYVCLNRNKRSLALDLAKPGAKDALGRVLRTADAFVTNVRPQGIARLGFDYESVRAVKPNIVYVHVVGFLAEGPYAGRAAYDDLIQAASGMADLWPKMERSGPPRFMPTLVADKVVGLHAVYGLLAALLQRERTGAGQFVEVPMLEATVSFTLAEHLYGHAFEPPIAEWGYTRILTPNRRPFQTRDAYIAVLPYSPAEWAGFFEAAGRPDLWERWRHMTFAERTAAMDEMYGAVAALARERTTDEWMRLLDAKGVPCMRVNRLDDLERDPHLAAVRMFEVREHASPDVGRYRTLRHPVRFSAAATPVSLDPPRLGADGRALLREVGLDDAAVDALVADGSLVEPGAG
jgi:crotonobetainyl-CoA:carnitine CoA-transferase CaiB-like acyl-CoA transferase